MNIKITFFKNKMLFKNNTGYLTIDNKIGNRNQAALIEEEFISSNITRLKIASSYLGCGKGKVFSTVKSDDSSLFVCDKKGYLTIDNLYLTLDNNLTSSEETNLIVEYLEESEYLLRKFKRDGLVTWKSELDDLLLEKAKKLILKNKNDRISNLFELDPVFLKFLQDKMMKILLNEILTEYHLTTFSSNTLRKDVDKRGFHVDYPYHDLLPPFPEDILGIQVIFALTDFTSENGATLFVPYSFQSRTFPNKVQSYEQILVNKGSVIMFRGDLWHSQGKNTTYQERVGLLANFAPLNIPAKDDIISQVINMKIENGKVLL